jgi:hypothetical protein
VAYIFLVVYFFFIVFQLQLQNENGLFNYSDKPLSVSSFFFGKPIYFLECLCTTPLFFFAAILILSQLVALYLSFLLSDAIASPLAIFLIRLKWYRDYCRDSRYEWHNRYKRS